MRVRNHTIVSALLLGLLLLPGWALAQDRAGTRQELELVAAPVDPGYCRFIKGVVDSERATLMYPELYSILGPASSENEPTGAEGGSSGEMALRFTLGLQYRFISLYQGVLMGRRADVECRRYLAWTELRAAIAVGKDWGLKPALEAQARVLEEALPRAVAQLDNLYSLLASNTVTVDELYTIQLKVDALREMANRVRFEIERLENSPEPPSAPLDEILHRYYTADDELERREAQIRRTKPWAVDIKGGYEQNFGDESKHPFFAQIRLSFNFGAIAQPFADRRALEGRRAWRTESLDGVGVRVAALQHDLKTMALAKQARLVEVSALAEEIAGRIQTLDAVQTEKSRRFRDLIWLDFVRLDAERRHLETHLHELRTLLGPL